MIGKLKKISACALLAVFSMPSVASITIVERAALDKPIGSMRLSQSALVNNYDDFKPALKVVMGRILESYQTQVEQILVMDVFDSNEKGMQEMLSSLSTNTAHDPTISLGIHFERAIEVNGKRASSCAIQYRPEGVDAIVRSYEGSRVFNRKEVLLYIAAHEMGHCFAYHQTSIGEFKTPSIKEHELLADKFAMALFYANGQPDSAKRIVEFNEKHSVSEMHRHPRELNEFTVFLDALFKNGRADGLIKSSLDLFYLASDQGNRI